MRFIQFFGFIFTISIFNYSIGQLTLPPSLITSNVPEASQYKVVYDLTIPTASGTITYAQNNSNTSGVVYNKVAYFMQLDTKWLWVSMDKFNANLTLAQLAIPVLNSGIVFQQIVTGMNVTTSGNTGISNVTNGNGNIEFWPYCYGTSNGLSGIGGDISKYDFNDLMDVNLNQCYGSFQVHNYNASQTLFAFNNFVSAGQTPDLGIGNNSGVASNGQSNPDWTFMGNSPNYTTRKLYILVDACSEISVTTQPNSAAINLTQNSTGNSLSVGASTTFGNINSYQWYSNSSATYSGSTLISGASSATYIIPTSTIGSNYYYCVIGNTNGCSVNSAISGLVKVDPYVWNGSVSNALTNTSNWSSGDVPPNGSSITFAASASNNLVLDANRTYGAINFNGSNKKIEIGIYNLTVSSITGANSTNYVKTSGTGKLVFTIPNNTTFDFVIGNSSYNPVSITNKSGASDVFSARVVDGAFMEGLTGAAITSTVLNRTWDISKTNANAGSGVDFVFNWNAGEVANGSFVTPKMNHYSSSTSNWEVPTVTSTVFGSNMLTVTGYTGTFSPFTIAEGSSPLPVELTSFNANCTENATTINWQTASEHNSAYFEVEKSRDGLTWNVVETVNAAGNSTSTIDYSTIDSEKAMDVVYYRLNQVDIDGASKIYGPISVSCDETNDFTATIFPNPTAKDFSVSFLNSEAQNFDIQLIGTDGKVVYQTTRLVEAGATILPLSSEYLNAGVYSLHVKGENTLKTIKLVVQ
jgi:hypothetical protein